MPSADYESVAMLIAFIHKLYHHYIDDWHSTDRPFDATCPSTSLSDSILGVTFQGVIPAFHNILGA
ncbi:uncharacterized protein P174DRAFT_421879 [Aspergillus novofumigatus IBT 16806]|uniref:Uncharacterized protein n=1 Tax=Aspergillus novofumigatus (strain IBT 16806) TaxID=1392255 RepID=A0A2I1C5F6_ASPN1|nr:uncharacterized protein P174DRAFT_421879 [Aspergillus novofumigatus IBT 16806]PKX92842.1 hypothetical protein P174DRAFT_421879 [Aspergillus novofumigatus IBT 16806]